MTPLCASPSPVRFAAPHGTAWQAPCSPALPCSPAEPTSAPIQLRGLSAAGPAKGRPPLRACVALALCVGIGPPAARAAGIYASHQVLLAQAIGAEYAAPYLGRMNDVYGNNQV